jgi:Domain of unknown function (DUF3336)
VCESNNLRKKKLELTPKKPYIFHRITLMIQYVCLQLPLSSIRNILNFAIFFLTLALTLTCNSCGCLISILRKIRTIRSDQIQKHLIKDKLKNSETYEDWLRYAVMYDNFRSLGRWRTQKSSSLYDWKYISKLEQLIKRYIV